LSSSEATTQSFWYNIKLHLLTKLKNNAIGLYFLVFLCRNKSVKIAIDLIEYIDLILLLDIVNKEKNK